MEGERGREVVERGRRRGIGERAREGKGAFYITPVRLGQSPPVHYIGVGLRWWVGEKGERDGGVGEAWAGVEGGI